MKLDYIMMMLNRTPDQQAELDRLLVDQQDPLSPSFHQWLEPEQFADRFGASSSDVGKIRAWLESEGLRVIAPARGRNWISFTGTAGQVQTALKTEIRRYRVDGEMHYANSIEPSVPEAIAPMVMGLIGLDDFRPKAPTRITSTPDFSAGSSHYLAPDDLAIIYNIMPIYKAGIDGSGQKLAIAGQTAIQISDMRLFRSTFSLSNTDPQVVLVQGSTDPGVTADYGEAVLDVQWTGAVARGAQLIYVYSSNVAVSAAYAIDQNLAPVLSYSYGLCEPKASGTTLASAFQAVAQQGNAQGITWFASSGDAGAAGCDRQGQNTVASNGAAVNLPASVPEVTAVGGTQFADLSGNFWGSNSGTGSSALGYIPEIAWNESGSNSLLSTGGGLSTFYPKPQWQVGQGVPGANARALPDISLTAAVHDGYITFENAQVSPTGGTSASTPSFAGLVTLLNQYTNSKGQGNINPNLYRLAGSPAASSVFHDITSGNNIIPCAAGSPNCSQGAFGYRTSQGFDPVTGWGSVDATALFNNWTNSQIATAVTVTANPPSVPLNGSTQVTATVRAIGSGGTPDGSVTFLFGRTSLGAAALSGGSATLTVYASQLPAGNDMITVTYSGTTTFSSSSGSVAINVSVPTTSAAVIPSISPNPVYQQNPDSDGYSWFYTIRLTEVAGIASTLTGFTIDSNNDTSQIQAFFGTSTIVPHGTISASLRTRGLTPPVNRVFVFSGVDANGHQWTQQITVPFLGQQISASMQLSGLPNTVHQDITSTDPTCQWFQNLGLQEGNGHAVYLTKFLAGGDDLSDQIADFFGDTYLPPFGSLLGGVCWTINGTPQTIDYEVDGIDDQGNPIVATLSSQFLGPPASSGKLTTNIDFIQRAIASSSQSSSATVSVNLPATQQWTVSIFPSNRTTSWLTVYPLSGTGPATLNIAMSGSGLAAGLYQAVLVFQSENTLPQSANVYINFTVGTPNITQVLNAGSLVDSGLSPGLIFAIKGTGLGPLIGQNTFLDDNGRVTSDISGVQVFVNNFPAPLLYVSAVQINAVVPYEVARLVGQRVNIQVVNNNVSSNIVTDQVVATAPAVFDLGGGQGAIRNSDNSVNGPGNPAARGSFIAIYGTGEGQTNPPGIDGRIATDSLPNLPRPAAPFSITIGGVTAAFTYDGTVPGSFEGFFQVNAQIPNNLPSGPNQVILNIGGVRSVAVIVVVQ